MTRGFFFSLCTFTLWVFASARVKMEEVHSPQTIKDDQEYRDSLQFFETLLRKGSPCRLEDEYPLVFHPNQKDNIFLVRLNEQIHAGLGTLVREIEIRPGEWANALFIGSVVTSLESRRKGLQRLLFHKIEEACERWDIDLLVLWSNQIEFYQKLGFELSGLQASWFPTHQGNLVAKRPDVRLGATRDLHFSKAMFDAFHRKTCRVARSIEEMRLLWRIPQMTVAMTDHAYALMGKGEDFVGVCHEWAGPADEVLACFDALRSREPNLRILSPGVLHSEEEMAVVSALEAASYETRLEYLGLMKVVSRKLEMPKLLPEQLEYSFFIWGLDSI